MILDPKFPVFKIVNFIITIKYLLTNLENFFTLILVKNNLPKIRNIDKF